jgi:hypothetical protein
MHASEPQLHRRYRRDEIMALFGADGGGKMLGDGQWVILPGATICMTTLGDPPAHPHFESAARFRWVAENPQRDEPRLAVETFQGRSRQPSQATIWLFVRRPEWDDYLYAGRLASPNSWGHRAGSWHVNFELSPTLPTAVWTELQGAPPADREHARLGAMLSGLGPSTTTQVRFATLRALVEYWHGKIGADDGLPDAALDGARMPAVLMQWYRWAGRRADILSGQNFLLAPDRLRIEDGRLFFYHENQGCYLWATLPEGDDPPVFGREDERDAWQPEGMALSEHLILAALFEAILRFAPYGAHSSWVDHRRLEEIAKIIPPLAIPPWRWNGHTQIHAGGGAFMVAIRDVLIGGQRCNDIWIGAKQQEPLLFLRSFPDIDWSFAAF